MHKKQRVSMICMLGIALFCASATADACPVGQKLIIDNGDPGYSETGDDWTTWPNAGQSLGTDYRYLSHTVGGSDRVGTATWRPPSLPADGMYKVEAVFRATENRSPDADYFVHDADGKVSHRSVDQVDGSTSGNSHGPVYADLGTYHLATGKGHVILDGTDDNYSDEADAVVFTLVSCGTAPPPPPGPCVGITNAGHELCQESATRCAGVYNNGAGCVAFCNAVGMVCVAMYGGETGCQKESSQFACGTDTGHDTDWCECELTSPPTPDAGPSPDTTVDGSLVTADSAPPAKFDASVQPTDDAGVTPENIMTVQPRPTVEGGCSFSPRTPLAPPLLLLASLLLIRRRRTEGGR